MGNSKTKGLELLPWQFLPGVIATLLAACSPPAVEGEWELTGGQQAFIGIRVVPPFANVRAAPSTTAPILWTAAKGQLFVGIGRSGEWYQVASNDYRPSWIHQSVAVTDAVYRPFLHITRSTRESIVAYCQLTGAGADVRASVVGNADLLAKGLREQLLPVLDHRGDWQRVLLPNGSTGWAPSGCRQGSPFVGPQRAAGAGPLALSAYSVKTFGRFGELLGPIDLELVEEGSVCGNWVSENGGVAGPLACANFGGDGELRVVLGEPGRSELQAQSIGRLRQWGWALRSALWYSIVVVGTLLGGFAGLLVAAGFLALATSVGGAVAIGQGLSEKNGGVIVALLFLLWCVGIPIYIAFWALARSMEWADRLLVWWK